MTRVLHPTGMLVRKGGMNHPFCQDLMVSSQIKSPESCLGDHHQIRKNSKEFHQTGLTIS